MGNYPLLEGYLQNLPRGFDSFPQCQIKASVIRDALLGKQLPRDEALPEPIRALVRDLPPVSTLIPEVLSNATLLAICDAHFAPGDRDAAWSWMHDATRRLLRTPLYRVLFAMMSPQRMAHGVAQRWAAFRRGTELTMVREESGLVQLRLRSPAHLHADMTLFLMAAAIQAALGCVEVSARVKLEAVTPVDASFACSWKVSSVWDSLG